MEYWYKNSQSEPWDVKKWALHLDWVANLESFDHTCAGSLSSYMEKLCIYLLIHLWIIFLSIDYAPGTLLDPRDTTVDKTDGVHALRSYLSSETDNNAKYILLLQWHEITNE